MFNKTSTSINLQSLIIPVSAVLLFLLLLLPALSVNFMQNDEWVHYRTVLRFLDGNFTLEPIIGSTFYIQGVLGALFAALLGVKSIPVLTLAVSVVNFALFAYILKVHFGQKSIDSVLIGLLLFFNPLHLYLSFGFMIENYLLLFVLLSFYFYLDYIKKKTTKFLIVSLIFVFFAFLVKQMAVVLLVAYIIDLFIKKEKKKSIQVLLVLIGIVLFYFFLFPRTGVMVRKTADLSSLFNLMEVIQFVSQYCVYIVSFLMPLVIILVYKKILQKGDKLNRTLILLLGVFIIFFVFLMWILTGLDYPYFENTFLNKGFFPGGLSGNKYHFRGFYDLFRLWKLASITLTAALFAALVYKKSIKLSISAIFVLIYIPVLLVLPSFFDRYIVLAIPFAAIFIIEQIDIRNLDRLIIGGFLLFLIFVGYQYSMDYIGWQRYVWGRAEELVAENAIPKSSIEASHAWNRHNGVSLGKVTSSYKFTFDSPEVLNSENAKLIEVHENEFPLSLFINPKIYLYEY